MQDAIFSENGLVDEPYPGAIGIYNLGAKAKARDQALFAVWECD